MEATSELAHYPELTGFRLIQELGRSPKGIVYKARRLVEQDVVAVKLFRDTALREAGFREGLERNAESTFLLEHPGLVRCLGCLQDQGRALLVMEYARGEPLSRALQRNVRFLPPRALAVAFQCADALRYACERKRFHGRLHPGDVILGEEDVSVLGVGLGEHPEHADWKVKDAHLFAPLIYSAPEALPSRPFPAAEDARRAVDLYALGALLYHMLTGTPPFRGSDEGTLAQERASLSPAVLRWPRGSERTLPPRALAVVERLLALEPLERGSYENVLASLEEAWREAEGKPVPIPKSLSAPLPPLAPAEVAPRLAALAKPRSLEDGPGGHAPAPALAPPRRTSLTTHRYDERRGERISTALLIGATGLVFIAAMALAAKTFLFNAPPAAGPVLPTGPEATPANPPKTALTALEPAGAGFGSDAAADAEAAGQLALIEDMLKTGEARYSSATLRELHKIKSKTSETSRAGMKVRLKIAEVEERLAGGLERGSAATPITAAAGASDAEEKVFREILARAKEQAGRQHFGAALATLRELPSGLKLAPFPERAAQEIKQWEKEAAATFADASRAADAAAAQGDFAKARGLFQTFQMRVGITEWEDAAAARLRALQEADEKAQQAKVVQAAQKNKQQELAALAALLRTAAEKAGLFRYAEAKEPLEQFAAKAGDAEARKLAADYAKLIQDELWLFNRCRQRLKDYIERDPNRSSQLQLFDKNKNPIADLVDFDERGITFALIRGGATGTRTREWSTLAPTQPLETLKDLRQRDSAPEQLALAMMAFHLALKAEADLRKAEVDPAKANNLQASKTTAKDLRNEVQVALNAAVQSDQNAREKQAAQRALLERISEILTPPPAVPQP